MPRDLSYIERPSFSPLETEEEKEKKRKKKKKKEEEEDDSFEPAHPSTPITGPN